MSTIGFNPCFPGTRSSTPWDGISHGTHRTVSILVFLELALRPNFWAVVSAGVLEFQSLFSWNSLFDPIGAGIPRLAMPCFNPCFPGTRSSTLSGSSTSISLFGFNPCFPGTRSSTIRLATRIGSGDSVSILVFLELALRPPTKVVAARA